MATASKKPEKKKPEWTQAHQDAFDALRTMKVPEKEARKHLENLPPGEAGELMRQALRARSGAVVRKPEVPAGGPQNAMPIVQQAAPAAPVAPRVPFSTRGAPTSFREQSQQIDEAEAARQAALKRVSSGWSSLMPKAPISPAVAQLSVPSMVATNAPDRPAMPGPPQIPKPRIRVPAAGRYVPPAPIGAGGQGVEIAPATNAPAGAAATPSAPATQTAAPPRIRSEEEYEKLAPGAEFVWIPDGHIYKKPAEGGEQ